MLVTCGCRLLRWDFAERLLGGLESTRRAVRGGKPSLVNMIIVLGQKAKYSGELLILAHQLCAVRGAPNGARSVPTV
jgi:hypothetical protein